MQLNSVIRSALADTAVKQRCPSSARFPVGRAADTELAAYHNAEIEKWWPVIKAANIKAE